MKNLSQITYLSKATLAEDFEELEVVHSVLAEPGDGGGRGCDSAVPGGGSGARLFQTEGSIALPTHRWPALSTWLWRRTYTGQKSIQYFMFQTQIMLLVQLNTNIISCSVYSIHSGGKWVVEKKQDLIWSKWLVIQKTNRLCF